MTGGVGFIGLKLARKLVDVGYEVLALDSLLEQVHQDIEAEKAAFPGEIYVGDVSDDGAWSQLPQSDVIIHLAAETGTAQSMYETDRYRRVNVDGTRIAAEYAVEWGIPLISLSSRAVYGEGFKERGTREDDAHAPLSVYGETKSEGEDVVREITQSKVPSVIIRPQNVIGPGQALHNPYTGVLAAFLARLREGKNLSVYGDGTATRDFIHVEDVADFIIWAIDNLPDCDESPRVLNLGSGERITLDQLAQYSIDAVPGGSKAVIEHVDVKRAGDINHALADMSYAYSLNAPKPRWSARESIADFIQKSWEAPGAKSEAWDTALEELTERGLAE
ncbi:NAD(P)-dependent oxidoreductase [Rothia sp. ZJ1223]|uniref:NAD-dependent epimerase/dehydratase family protein n=1 Tax=Rothia sp. ZJ1223 TaxID=2811098 RepID=UPI001EF6B991|nr:NAD-dependent epimerase/dehydratase family protein [Rothia sp. ZJ1223]